MDPRKAINAQKNRPEHLYITKQTNRKKTAQQYLIWADCNIFIKLKKKKK